MAAKALGADTVSVAASTSSVTKGESLIDTIRTLQALGADFVVMRHHQAGAPYVVAEEVSASVINAGDGWHAHPTQALLDLFTIRERLGRIAGLRVAIVGDMLHSRVARSNLWGLTPDGRQRGAVRTAHAAAGVAASATACRGTSSARTSWTKRSTGADVVMLLRMQLERQSRRPVSERARVRAHVRLDGRAAGARQTRRGGHASGPDERGRRDRSRESRAARSRSSKPR